MSFEGVRLCACYTNHNASSFPDSFSVVYQSLSCGGISSSDSVCFFFFVPSQPNIYQCLPNRQISWEILHLES